MRALMSGALRGKRAAGAAVLGTFLASLFPSTTAPQSLSVNPGRFGAMTCQQLWYVEQEVLAEGRVCLRTERARRAFRRAERCISDDETILPQKVLEYLATLRRAAREKGCAGF
ncbi:MAG: hypothetical protein Tsb0019_18740 [Roseibium sp.]